MTYSNQIFSAFAFIGFILCAIPFYWHLEGKVYSLTPTVTILIRATGLSLERWYLLVHGLGWPGLLEFIY